VLCPSPRTVAPSPCLLLDIKDLLKEDVKFFMGGLAEGKLLEGKELLKRG
jgi:hypothetical protein